LPLLTLRYDAAIADYAVCHDILMPRCCRQRHYFHADASDWLSPCQLRLTPLRHDISPLRQHYSCHYATLFRRHSLDIFRADAFLRCRRYFSLMPPPDVAADFRIFFASPPIAIADAITLMLTPLQLISLIFSFSPCCRYCAMLPLFQADAAFFIAAGLRRIFRFFAAASAGRFSTIFSPACFH